MPPSTRASSLSPSARKRVVSESFGSGRLLSTDMSGLHAVIASGPGKVPIRPEAGRVGTELGSWSVTRFTPRAE